MQIRQAGLSDLDGLALLFNDYRIFYEQPSDIEAARAFLRERLERAQSIVFLACDQDGTALGFAQLYPSFSSVALQPLIILNDLFVSASARQRGLGTALLSAAADHARSVGAGRLTLATATGNHSAQSLYEANGWMRETAFFRYNLTL